MVQVTCVLLRTNNSALFQSSIVKLLLKFVDDIRVHGSAIKIIFAHKEVVSWEPLSSGLEFESQHRILDGYFCKNCNVCLKRRK